MFGIENLHSLHFIIFTFDSSRKLSVSKLRPRNQHFQAVAAFLTVYIDTHAFSPNILREENMYFVHCTTFYEFRPRITSINVKNGKSMFFNITVHFYMLTVAITLLFETRSRWQLYMLYALHVLYLKSRPIKWGPRDQSFC